MKNTSALIFLVAILFYMCGESKQPADQQSDEIVENPARKIVDESIAAHGGWDNWKNMTALTYSKAITLYDSAGLVESQTNQIHDYLFKPNNQGTISWTTDREHSISYDENGAVKLVDGVIQEDSASMEEATSTYLSSHYVLFQPWKLLDPGVGLIYQGKDEFEDGSSVHVVKLTFENSGPDSDIWWFYFNEETKLLAGYIVKHGDRFSFIRNESYDSTTLLTFPHHRFSHFVSDSTRNNKLLRAEYYYENFEMN